MKKIGVLFGRENSFPQALVDRINQKKVKGVVAELAQVGEVFQSLESNYSVIFDRISQDVPFYRSYLKTIALTGTKVINNPFWWSADEKFINNTIAQKVGVPVPKTVLLPSKDMPDDTSAESFRNLKFPLDWQAIFDHIGFPAYMKPHAGGGWKSVYKVESPQDFFMKFQETNQLVMMLQENIEFDSYWRCYCVGRKYVRVMPYEPRNPHHLRYVADFNVPKSLMDTIEKYVLALNEALGYELNTVEFAVRDGIPYAIDFCNPAPDADLNSVGEENFEWVVEHVALYAIECALANNNKKTNLSWGSIMVDSINDSVVQKEAASKKKRKKKPLTIKNSKPLPLTEEFPYLEDAVEVIDVIPQPDKIRKRGRPATTNARKSTTKADQKSSSTPLEEQFPYLKDIGSEVIDVEVSSSGTKRGRPVKNR